MPSRNDLPSNVGDYDDNGMYDIELTKVSEDQKHTSRITKSNSKKRNKKLSNGGLQQDKYLSANTTEISPPSEDSRSTTHIRCNCDNLNLLYKPESKDSKNNVTDERNIIDDSQRKVDENTSLILNKSHDDIPEGNPTTIELIICLIRIIGPTMFSNILVFSIQTITNSYIGRRLGPTEFANFTIGVSTYNLFAFSFGVGLATALDTLVSHAHGRTKQRGPEIGIYFQQALLITIILSIPIGFILTFGEPVFCIVYGTEFGSRAVQFTRNSIPLFFVGTFYQVCIKTVVSINKPKLPIYASVCTLIMCVILNHYFTFSIVSAVYVLTFTYSTGFVVLMAIIRFHPRVHFWRDCPWSASREVVRINRIGKYLAIGIPSLISGCSDWWFYELLNVVAALISVQTVAMMNVWLTVGLILFSAALSNSVAVSVRVGNSLGANRPTLAKRYAYMGMAINLVMALTNATILFLFKSQIVSLFTNEQELIASYCRIAPLISLHHICDVMPVCLSGAYRGAGKPHQSAKIAVASLWLVGGPCTVLFGKYMEMGTEGIIIGVTIGVTVETLFLLIGICYWNWEDIAHKTSSVCHGLNVSVSCLTPQEGGTSGHLGDHIHDTHEYCIGCHSCQGVYSAVCSSHSSSCSSSPSLTPLSLPSSIPVYHSSM